MKSPIVIAGPCSVENEEQILVTARALAQIPEVGMLRGGIWKPRTRPEAFEGRGEEGLKWLLEAKHQTHQRRFATARLTHDAYIFARLYLQRQVVKNQRTILLITERHT